MAHEVQLVLTVFALERFDYRPRYVSVVDWHGYHWNNLQALHGECELLAIDNIQDGVCQTEGAGYIKVLCRVDQVGRGKVQ